MTVKERILLHLFDFTRYADDYTVPLGVTQSGIVDAVGIRVQHATQYLRPLVEADLVVENVRHIEGQARRRKTYFLSPGGRREASALRSSLFEETVRFRRRSGREEELSLAQVYQEERRGSALVELVQEIGETALLTEQVRATPSEFVDYAGEAPPVEDFYGRQEELTGVTEALQSAPVVVVTGLAGIGKSTLAAKVVEAHREKASLFWREVRPWDSATDLGRQVGAFLRAAGRPGLHNHLRAAGAVDLNRVEEILAGEVAGLAALLVFDDVQDASPTARDFLSTMHRALRRQEGGARMLVLSRTRPDFYDTADAELQASVREVPLRGWEEEVSLRFLADRGLPGEAAASVVQASGGSPLFLKLLAKAAEGGAVEQARGSIEGHIAREIEPSLGDGEREVLQLASLYAIPVPSEALLLGGHAEARDLISLQEKSLVDRATDGRLLLHDFLRDYFGKSLPAKRRADLAAQAAGWLGEESERRVQGRDLEGGITLLEHAVAIDPEESRLVANHRRLGDLRTGTGDWTGALETYRVAIAGSEDPHEKARMHWIVSGVLRRLFRMEETEREIEQGLALLPPGPSVEAAHLLMSRAVYLAWSGRAEESARTVEEVGHWLLQLPRDDGLRFWWTDFSAVPRISDPTRRDYVEALRLTKQAIAIYERGQLGLHWRLFIQSYAIAAWACFLLGRMEEALGYVDRGWADVEDSGAVVERGNLLTVKGYVLSEGLGRFEEAEAAYNDALRWLTATRQDFRILWMPHLFAGLYHRQGRPEDARESLAYFLARSEDALDPEDRLDSHAWMARLCVEGGDLEEAQSHLAQAEELLGAAPSEAARFSVAWAKGIIQTQLGEEESAGTAFQEALELHPPPLRGETFHKMIATEFLRGEFLLSHGRFLASSGHGDRAAEVLTAALEEARERSRVPLQAAVEHELHALPTP